MKFSINMRIEDVTRKRCDFFADFINHLSVYLGLLIPFLSLEQLLFVLH